MPVPVLRRSLLHPAAFKSCIPVPHTHNCVHALPPPSPYFQFFHLKINDDLHEVVKPDSVLLHRRSPVLQQLLDELTRRGGGGVQAGHHDELAQLVGEEAILEPITGFKEGKEGNGMSGE